MNRHEPMTAEDDVRGTPWELFNPLHAHYQFTLDVCASECNHKLPRYYSEMDNGLHRSWKNERVYCNPPYSDICSWVLKAWDSQAALVYMLLPSTRTEQEWWQTAVEPFRDGRGSPDGSDGLVLHTDFLPKRHKFLAPDGLPVRGKDGKVSAPKFGCVGLVWLPTTQKMTTGASLLAK